VETLGRGGYELGGTEVEVVGEIEGRALQLATYAAARRQQSGSADVRVAYLLIADGTVHTPEGSPLHGAARAALVGDAPAIHDTWRFFAAALAGAEGWLRGEEPIPLRPHQDPEAWPPGAEPLDPSPRLGVETLPGPHPFPGRVRTEDWGILGDAVHAYLAALPSLRDLGDTARHEVAARCLAAHGAEGVLSPDGLVQVGARLET